MSQRSLAKMEQRSSSQPLLLAVVGSDANHDLRLPDSMLVHNDRGESQLLNAFCGNSKALVEFLRLQQ